MTHRRSFVLVLSLAAVGCGAAEPTEPVVPSGYERLTTMPIVLAPGQEVLVNEWLTAPLDHDVDVADVIGEESAALHHFILYATPDAEPVGTMRTWQDSDQVTLGLRLVGGFGKEAQAAYRLPPGVVHRIAAGHSLLANVHYLNATAEQTTARAWVDVKLAPPSPSSQVAAMFVSLDLGLSVAPHAETSFDVSCTMEHDVGLFAWANHMHELGASTSADVLRKDGTTATLRRDEVWAAEQAFNPRFTTWPLAAPFVLHAGDTVRSRCNWDNPGADTVTFPHEMCLGLGFFVGAKDVTCLGGKWME